MSRRKTSNGPTAHRTRNMSEFVALRVIGASLPPKKMRSNVSCLFEKSWMYFCTPAVRCWIWAAVCRRKNTLVPNPQNQSFSQSTGSTVLYRPEAQNFGDLMRAVMGRSPRFVGSPPVGVGPAAEFILECVQKSWSTLPRRFPSDHPEAWPEIKSTGWQYQYIMRYQYIYIYMYTHLISSKSYHDMIWDHMMGYDMERFAMLYVRQIWSIQRNFHMCKCQSCLCMFRHIWSLHYSANMQCAENMADEKQTSKTQNTLRNHTKASFPVRHWVSWFSQQGWKQWRPWIQSRLRQQEFQETGPGKPQKTI